MKFEGQADFEKAVLNVMFKKFQERELAFAVLRNYEQLPESVGARDIDILVYPDSIRLVPRLICDVAMILGLGFANFYSDERMVQFTLYYMSEAETIYQIKLDFFVRSEVYGVEVMSASYMLSDREYYNGIPVVSDSTLLLDKLVFHLLVGQPLDSKYDGQFGRILAKNRERITLFLESFMGGAADSVVSSVERGEASRIPSLTLVKRLMLLSRLWVKQGGRGWYGTPIFIYYRMRDFFKPNGVFLSISGPDGSGKTTVIDKVLHQLNWLYGEKTVHYFHFRPNIMPRIAELASASGVNNVVDDRYDQPHRAAASGFAMSMVRFFYYSMDFFLGYLSIACRLLRRRQVVVFDRYFYDLIVDPRRTRIGLPFRFLKSFLPLMPLPRHAFFLRVDSDEIFRRKQELELPVIRELNLKYECLARSGDMLSVDNSGSPEAAVFTIVNTILSHRNAKIIRTLL